jgi:putative ABC transport system permease protein
MNRIRAFWIRILNLFRQSKLNRDLAEQLESHRQMIKDDLIAKGMEPSKAERTAKLSVGNESRIRELSRDEHIYRSVDESVRDLRHGMRMLTRNKLFAMAAVLSLAVGIGANTFVFSLTNSTLLHSSGYPDPERLVAIWTIALPDALRPAGVGTTTTSSVSQYFALRDQAQTFQDIGAFNGGACGVRSLGGDQDVVAAERLYGQCFSPSLFRVLGVSPFLGRTFTDDEDRIGNVAPVVLLGHSLWRTRFGADPKIVGRTVMLNQVRTTVIGVLPPDFRLFRDPNIPTTARPPLIEFVAPLELGPTQVNSRIGGNTLVARLKPGVSAEQAEQEINGLAAELAAREPMKYGGRTFRVEALQGVIHRDYRAALYLLHGAVGFVLLISCANVAGLLLARNSSRRDEVALRLALGAGRTRIARQLVAENLPLAFVGGAIGVSLALLALSTIRTLPAEFALLEPVTADMRVLFFTVAVILATAALFAILPAIRAVRPGSGDPLKEVSRSATASAHRQRLRSVLVGGQIALATVLLIGAGLMINSFARVAMKDLGADPANLLTFAFHLPPAETIKVTGMYRGTGLAIVHPKPAMLVERLLDKLENVPGVTGVAAASLPPFAFAFRVQLPFFIEGRREAVQPETADYLAVTRGFFGLMKIPITKGRDFDAHDNEAGRPVVIINETMAQRFFPSQDPIGKHITFDFVPDERSREVIGIAGNTFSGLETQHQPTIYVPHLQQPSQWVAPSWTLRSGAYLLVRTNGNPERLFASVKAVVAEVDPNTPAADMGTVEQTLDNQTRTLRLYVLLLGVFATVAALMAAMGIYGVVAYSVAARTREIGIRMALGSRPQAIIMMVFRQVAVTIAAGLGVGIVSAVALSRLLQSLLFEISATDAVTYGATLVLLLAISIAACIIPARRAAAIDPVLALKHE